jgi:trimethylamine:corrinoid methyltransferase-like protein
MSAIAIKTLHEATLRLLERTGVHIDSQQALSLLAGAGLRVDRAGRRAYPSARDVERALAAAPKSFVVYGRSTEHPLRFDGTRAYFLSGGASLRVLELDGRLSPANLEHLHLFNRLLDALPFVHMLINQVDPVEFHGPDLHRLLAAEMLLDTPKPI